MRRHRQQSTSTPSPQQLIVTLYDVGITACYAGDRPQVRGALVELIGNLNLEDGGDTVSRLHALYEFCLNESVDGDLNVVCDLLTNLRNVWIEAARRIP